MPPVAEQDAPAVDSALVSQPENSALYMSRRSLLRLVLEKKVPVRGPQGEQIDETEGVMLVFRDGVLRVPLDGEVTTETGSKIPSARALEFLDGHRMNGSLQEGFWRVDPTAPPISAAETEKLVEFAIALDADSLRTFIEQERNGWEREKLIEVAEGTLERVLATLENQQTALAKARAEGEAAAKKAPPKGSGTKAS